MRTQMIALTSVSLVLAAGSVTLAASGSGPGPQAPDEGDSRPHRAPVTAVPADQAAAFGVLRREAGPGDQLPPAALRAVVEGPQADFGANPALARRAAANAAGDLFLVPADGQLCLVTADGSAACNRPADAVRGYLVLVQSRGAGAARVSAALPDGVRRVEVASRGASTAAGADVEANVATVDAAGELEALSFVDAAGTANRVPLMSPPE